ncbi:DDE Tnp4 domain-containing protein [Trichonephila clavipes]|nr:DDE Tnp4 domain-containing protein [Trichonephila clavipes]
MAWWRGFNRTILNNPLSLMVSKNQQDWAESSSLSASVPQRRSRDYRIFIIPDAFWPRSSSPLLTPIVAFSGDSESYRRFLRMDVSTFEELVALYLPSIERKNTSMRKAIPAAERIALTLRYLATGETQSSLSYQFRIAQNTISGIIPAVCAAIYHHLGSEIRVPESGNEWKMVAEEFWAKWNFPLCLGAMDGKLHTNKTPLIQEQHTETTRGFFQHRAVGPCRCQFKIFVC